MWTAMGISHAPRRVAAPAGSLNAPAAWSWSTVSTSSGVRTVPQCSGGSAKAAGVPSSRVAMAAGRPIERENWVNMGNSDKDPRPVRGR